MTQFREPIYRRYRRAVLLGGWAAGVLMTVLLYRVSEPKPTYETNDASGKPIETIQVGALPVT